MHKSRKKNCVPNETIIINSSYFLSALASVLLKITLVRMYHTLHMVKKKWVRSHYTTFFSLHNMLLSLESLILARLFRSRKRNRQDNNEDNKNHFFVIDFNHVYEIKAHKKIGQYFGKHKKGVLRNEPTLLLDCHCIHAFMAGQW